MVFPKDGKKFKDFGLSEFIIKILKFIGRSGFIRIFFRFDTLIKVQSKTK
jgi:hypothetical protein